MRKQDESYTLEYIYNKISDIHESLIMICPQCSNDIPNFVKQCRFCFQSFEKKQPTKAPFFIGLGIFIFSIGAHFFMQHATDTHINTKYIISETAEAIFALENDNMVISSASHDFSKVDHIEHIQHSGYFSLVAVLKTGARLELTTNGKSLEEIANNYGSIIGVDVQMKNETRTGQ